MSITAWQPSQQEVQPVVWLDWDKYLAWLSGRLTHETTAWGERLRLGPPWQPGEHMALDGPTGEGKTTHAVGILSTRKYVLALDPKGEDDTLGKSGYVRVRSIPPPTDGPARIRWNLTHKDDAKSWDDIDKRLEAKLETKVIVGTGSRTLIDDYRNRKLMADALEYARSCGGWTLYVDEFELLSSPRMFGQGQIVERLLISARSAGTSVVTTFQAPAWISQHATRQSLRAVKWPTGDRNMIKKLAEAMGRDWRELGQAVDLLPPFHTITIPRGKRHPLVITSAPEL